MLVHRLRRWPNIWPTSRVCWAAHTAFRPGRAKMCFLPLDDDWFSSSRRSVLLMGDPATSGLTTP